MKKIRFLKDLDLDVYRERFDETEGEFYRRGAVLNVAEICPIGKSHVNLLLENSDLILEVPVNSFESVK